MEAKFWSKNILTGILIWMPTLFIAAQGFHIQQTTPTNLSLVNFEGQNITVDFNQPISSKKLDRQIHIFGEWTGPKDFDLSLENSNRRLVIALSSEDRLSAGEKLTINLSKHIQSDSGKELERGYAIQLYVASAPGTLIQTRKATIPLRNKFESSLKSIGTYAGDLNNDGYTDLTILNELASDLRVLINDTKGSYEKPQILSLDINDHGASRSADFDADGKIDLALGASNDQKLNVLMGDGWGGFENKNRSANGNATKGLAILDFNGDGDDDIAMTIADKSQLSLFTNDGRGNFTYRFLSTGNNRPTALEAADANNDGIIDLFLGFTEQRKIAIFLGDGAGNFNMSDEVKVIGEPWMLAVADLNGDHQADVASVNATGNVTVVILGDGTGHLQTPKTYALQSAKMPKGIDLGDIDGDGDMDMVTANAGSNNFIVWENNALGIMSKASILKAVQQPTSVILSDQDNDGDLDIIGTDGTTDEILIFDNAPNGSEFFAEVDGAITTQISPNPFRHRLKIKAFIPRTGRTDVRILDASGRTMERLWDDRLEAGQHFFGWDGRSKIGDTPSGIYYVSITQNGKTYTWPVSKG